ncbi:MAG: aspartate carbamoyltransferase catalytic subunit [Pseudomonadota bacterium]
MPPDARFAEHATHGRQLTDSGHLRHLITLASMPRELIIGILDRADQFLADPYQPAIRNERLKGRTVANLFFEPSTRTRASFELAAKRLGADVLNLDVSTSSRIKGESILDTIYTLEAMQTDTFVVRDAAAGVPQMIADAVRPGVSILNAGEASVSHPTQGLLDLLTIRRAFPDLAALRVCIVGDIAHSRVARSAAQALTTAGVRELRLVAPPSLQPNAAEFPGATLHDNLRDGVRDADVVMALRIQHERIAAGTDLPGPGDYARHYGLNVENLKGASDHVRIMHPGPMNRGVEIDGAIADSSHSLITEQVRNGVAVRMALLEMVHETQTGTSV